MSQHAAPALPYGLRPHPERSDRVLFSGDTSLVIRRDLPLPADPRERRCVLPVAYLRFVRAGKGEWAPAGFLLTTEANDDRAAAALLRS